MPDIYINSSMEMEKKRHNFGKFSKSCSSKRPSWFEHGFLEGKSSALLLKKEPK